MPSNCARVAVLLMLAVTLLAACGEAQNLDVPEQGSPPTSSPEVEQPPILDATPSSTPEPTISAVMDVKATAEIADDRLRDRNEYGMLDAWMTAIEWDTFAGGFIEHEPKHRYILLFTRDGKEALYRYVVPGSDLDEFIEIRPAEFSYSDLSAATGELNQMFSDLGYFPPSSTINVMRNRLELMVDDPTYVAQMLTDAGVALPASVNLIAGGGMLVSLATPEIVPGAYIAILKPQPVVARDGAFNEYTGTLALEDACLWIVPGQQSQRVMPIWPDSFRLLVVGDMVEVVNSAGIAVARVGDSIYLNGMEHDQSYLDRDELYVPIPEDCQPERVLDVISIDPLAHQPDMSTREPGYSPFDLFSVQWPLSFSESETLVSRLPELIGEPGMEKWLRTEDSGRFVIGYGAQDDPGSPRLTVTDLTTGTYFPDFWTVNDLVASQLISGVGLDNGFSPETSWALEDTSISGRVDRYASVPLYALTWGSNAGRVLFTATAADYAQLEMLVTAVVATVE